MCELSIQSADPTSKGRKTKAGSNGDADDSCSAKLQPLDAQVKDLGKQYALTIDPWIPKMIFSLPRPTEDFDDRQRYPKKGNIPVPGPRIAELYDFVPAHLHMRMATSGNFVSLVCNCMIVSVTAFSPEVYS